MNFRLTVRRILTAVQILLKRFGRLIYTSEYERNRDKWYSDNGDLTLRLNFPELTEHSIVFDLGGWQGEWASDIFSKYNSNIFVFEPVEKYSKFISDRFKANKKIKVFGFGLGSRDETVEIYIGNEGSSIFKNKNNLNASQTISIKTFGEFLSLNNIQSVDLLKINIEGGEYDLLEHILERGLASKIKELQIQFHDFVSDAVERRDGIQSALQQTHVKVFDYPFVWEGWKKP